MTLDAERAALGAERDAIRSRLSERDEERVGLQHALEQSHAALAEAQPALAEAEEARAALGAREQALSEEKVRLSAELQRVQDVLDGGAVEPESSASLASRALHRDTRSCPHPALSATGTARTND